MNALTPAPRSLAHVTDWVFDLDNTLYPRECNLFAQIDMLISHYVVGVTQLPFDEARALQKTYYRDFGTTLNGLMQRHEVDPDHFLKTVHRIDYSPVPAHPELVDAIRALPGPQVHPHQRRCRARAGGARAGSATPTICSTTSSTSAP